MSKYKYALDESGKKHLCPECGKKRFVRYIDSVSNEYLPQKYGRCDRESNCTYHLNPYKDGYGKNETVVQQYYPKPKLQQKHETFLPEYILDTTLGAYDKNTFIQNLVSLFPVQEVEKVIAMYRLGTINKGERTGAVTFPFIDRAGNIRTIQAKEFDVTNHTISTDYVHSILERHYRKQGRSLPAWLSDYLKNEKKVSCLFGEHFINKFPLNPVALVEAPKTAIISTLYYGLPETAKDLLWLAVYNKSSLSLEKCKALRGRNVVLYPDLNAFHDWDKRVKEISIKLPGTRFIVSDLLERNASPEDILKGLDLADYLTRFDYSDFRKLLINTEATIKPVAVAEAHLSTPDEKSEKSETQKQTFVSDDKDEPSQLLSETFQYFLDCPVEEKGEVIEGVIGKSGHFYVHLPGGSTNVYLKAEDCAKGLKPDHVLDYTQWMEVKYYDFDAWLNVSLFANKIRNLPNQ